MKKINIDRPRISSEEIKGRQNFEAIFTRYKELEQQPFYKKYWMYLMLLGIFSAAGTYYLLQQTESYTAQKAESPSQKTEIITEIREERIIDKREQSANKNNVPTQSKIPSTENKNMIPANSSLTQTDTAAPATTDPIALKNDPGPDGKILALNAEISALKQKINQLEAEKPLKPQEAQGNYIFKIDVLPSEFPKLSKYKGLLFEVPSDEKNFSPDFVKTEWNSGKIKVDTEGNYLLTLTKGKKSYTFKALPVFKGNAYNLALKEYNQYYETLDSLVKEEKKKEMQRNEFMK